MTTTKLSVAAVLLLAASTTINSGALSAESAPVDAFGDPLPPGAIARMGTVRLRHGGHVGAVAYSPDGKFLASSSAHGELRLWNADTGKLVRPFEDPTRIDFNVLAFSPDGQLLASDKGGTLGLWQVSTGQKLRDMEDKKVGYANSASFSPDGKELAFGQDHDSAIEIFDPATGKVNRKIMGHKAEGVVAVYSKDGKLLASGGMDGTARIWDAATGKELHRFEEPEPVRDVALSPDGKLLAAKTVNAVHLWNVASGKPVHQFEEYSGELRSLAFSPDGKLLGSCGVLWDVATGKEVCRLQSALQGYKDYPSWDEKTIDDMAFSPDGKTIVGGGTNGVVYLFDSATGKELPTSRVGWNRGMQDAVGFTPDGKRLVLSAAIGGGIHLCEAATGKVIRDYTADKEKFHVVVLSPDGKTLAAGTDYGIVVLWETATGKILYRLKGHKGGRQGVRDWMLAFAPDGRTLASMANENVVHLWDVSSGMELQQFRSYEGAAQDVRSSISPPDGKTLVSGGDDKTQCFWNAVNGKKRRTRLKQTDVITAVSPDGRLVAVHQNEWQEALIIQETAAGREVRRFPAAYARSCAFSPDGKTLAVFASEHYIAEEEQPIHLLELATGKTRMKLAGHRGVDGGPMVFSPDSRMLASGSSDTTAMVWDATGRMHGGRFGAAALSPRELRDSWAALASDDAAEAYRAVWALTSSPEQTLPLLKERLSLLANPDPKETARRLADLDGDEFDVREKAEKELGDLGDLVESDLRKALNERPSPEARQRITRLIQHLGAARRLQGLRVLEVLERIGTLEAEKVLKQIARGSPDARLTQEAKASLERLSRRPAP